MNTQKSMTSLNEKDSLQDMLNLEKQMLQLYSVAIMESSCKNLRSLLKQNFSGVEQDQYSVFQQMVNGKYYQPKPAEEQMIKEQYKTFSKVKQQLSN